MVLYQELTARLCLILPELCLCPWGSSLPLQCRGGEDQAWRVEE